MKIRIANYTFDASEKTVTFSDYASITLDAVLLVVNATDQVILYNFANASLGGTVASNVLTLEYDTTTMDDADKLIIYYDDSTLEYIKKEDAAHASGDAGIQILAVRDDTLNVRSGTENDYEPLHTNANGALWTIDVNSAAMAASLSTLAGAVSGTEMQVDVLTMPTVAVTGTFWQATQPVSAASLPLPTGASTLAEQQSQTTHLATIAGDTTSIQTAVELIDDTVATLGTTTYTEAATKGLIVGAVRRDADTTLVDTTNEVAPFIVDARGFLKVEAFSGETLPVSLTSTTITGTVAVTQSGTWDEVGINDSGNSITVDAPVGTPVFVRLSDGASAISALPITDNGGSLTVDGAVTISSIVIQKTEDQASANGDTGAMVLFRRSDTPGDTSDTDGDYETPQMSGGRLWVDASGKTLTVASHAVTNAGTFAVQVDGSALTALQLIDNIALQEDAVHQSGDYGVQMLAVRQDSQADFGADGDYVPLSIDANGALRVSGGGGGTQYATNDLYADTNVGTLALTIRDDALSTLTEADGDYSGLRVDSTGRLWVNVSNTVTVASHAVTNAGTFAVQVDGNALTSLQLIDDAIFADDAAFTLTSSKVMATGAIRDDALSALTAVEGDVVPLRVDANGAQWVVVSGTLTVASHAVTNAGTFAVQVDGAALTALQLIDDGIATVASAITTKGMAVVGTDGTNARILKTDTSGELQVDIVGALPVGNNAIGKLAANSGVDIGDVDVTSVIPGTGATNIGKAEDGGHTTGDTGVMALAVRVDTPSTALSGTDLDYTPIAVTSTGAVRTAPMSEDFAVLANGPQVKKYYTNAGAVTDGIIWSPAAGKRWYVTDIFINVSAAATVTLEDDLAAGDAAVWKAELAANSGWSHHYGTPLFSGEDAADLLITTSAGNVYVTVTGYEI